MTGKYFLKEITNLIIRGEPPIEKEFLNVLEDNSEKIGRYGIEDNGYSCVASSFIRKVNRDKESIIWTFCDEEYEGKAREIIKDKLKRFDIYSFPGRTLMLRKYDSESKEASPYSGKGNMSLVIDVPRGDWEKTEEKLIKLGKKIRVFEKKIIMDKCDSDGFYKPLAESTPKRGKIDVLSKVRYKKFMTLYPVEKEKEIVRELRILSRFELPVVVLLGNEGTYLLRTYISYGTEGYEHIEKEI